MMRVIRTAFMRAARGYRAVHMMAAEPEPALASPSARAYR